MKHTTGDIRERLIKILNEFTDKIGQQVTYSYVAKHGIWEGISTQNYYTIQKYIPKIVALIEEEKGIFKEKQLKYGYITVDRRLKKGLCRSCFLPRVNASHCNYHREKHNAAIKKYYYEKRNGKK